MLPVLPERSAGTPAHGEHLLGLLVAEAGVLRVDVRVGAGGRFERHGADGALVEHLAVGGLDVGLDGVDPSEDHSAAGTPGEREEGAGDKQHGELSCATETGAHRGLTAKRNRGMRARACFPRLGKSPRPNRHQDPKLGSGRIPVWSNPSCPSLVDPGPRQLIRRSRARRDCCQP